MRVAFVVPSLHSGGAEGQLLVLCKGLRSRGHDVIVAALYGGGCLESRFAAEKIPVQVMAPSRRWFPLGLLRLLRVLQRFRPSVVHGYLPLGNCAAVAARLVQPNARAVMGVRGVRPGRRANRVVTAFYELEAALSRRSSAVIANSEAARSSVVARGFPPERIHVVPNGIDVQRFRYDADARVAVRHEWGLTEQEVLIGRVGRIHPVKDYPTFLHAAALTAATRPAARFVCVGDGPEEAKASLWSQADQLGLAGRVLWAGHRDDMPAVMSALDVCVSSSAWESLPNVVGEAMACGVTCVVTDVGDSATLVGEEGFVVPAGDPAAMAEAIGRAIDCLRAAGRRKRTRRWIVDNFGPEAMIERTEEILYGLAPR